jgi:hypothetical protein
MTARRHYWYLTHPRLGRLPLLMGAVHALAVFAVCAAPQASASSNAVVLNWTGLQDTYGVPIGDYYLSLASAAEQITQAGPGVSWKPGSWTAWTLHALVVAGTHWSIANILTGEAGLFVAIIAIALVILRLTVSTYWLTVIGEIAHAISAAVVQVATRLGLLLICIPIGVFVGVVTVKRGEAGRGWTMILSAVTMPALSVAVFNDPAGEMYGANGLLAFGRRIGFSVAEAATHNGQFNPGVDTGSQVDSLTASLITHIVREPLQLWNFGHVVDRIGNCGAAWSAAVRGGAPEVPLHAMGACGDRAALVYGQHLDGTNAWLGLVFVFAAALLGVFVVASGWAVLNVSVKAIWTTVILLPALWVGSVPGAPQRRAIEAVWAFFRHGLEVMVHIVYVSVIGLAIERLVSSPLPTQLGGTNPFAHVLMMGATSVAALILLRHVRAETAGHHPGRGMLRRGADVAVATGVDAGVRGAASAGLAGAGKVGRSLRPRRERTPWDQIDIAANNAAQVHGPPQPGFEPILDTAHTDSSGRGDPPDAAAGSGRPTGGLPPPGPGEPGAGSGHGSAGASPILDRVLHGELAPMAITPRSGPAATGGRARDGSHPGAAHPSTGAPAASQQGPAPTTSGSDEPSAVPPVSEPPGTGDTEIPLPPVPPTDDASPPGPGDDGPVSPSPTTVSPITET